jgi:hypothetical protein
MAALCASTKPNLWKRELDLQVAGSAVEIVDQVDLVAVDSEAAQAVDSDLATNFIE